MYLIRGVWFPSRLAAGGNRSYSDVWAIIGDPWYPGYFTPTNLLDAIMKNEHFDTFDYIIDEIWNIAIDPQRSCGFTPYIMCMIEVVAHERFYKDAAPEPLRPAILKGPAHRHISPPPDVAPSDTSQHGGASSSSSSNSDFLKMFWGILAMCRHIDQHMNVMEHHLDNVRRN
jgi:hypothetical protein